MRAISWSITHFESTSSSSLSTLAKNVGTLTIISSSSLNGSSSKLVRYLFQLICFVGRIVHFVTHLETRGRRETSRLRDLDRAKRWSQVWSINHEHFGKLCASSSGQARASLEGIHADCNLSSRFRQASLLAARARLAETNQLAAASESQEAKTFHESIITLCASLCLEP